MRFCNQSSPPLSPGDLLARKTYSQPNHHGRPQAWSTAPNSDPTSGTPDATLPRQVPSTSEAGRGPPQLARGTPETHPPYRCETNATVGGLQVGWCGADRRLFCAGDSQKPLGSSVSLLFFAVGISCFPVQVAPVSQFAGQMKSKNKRNCIHTWGRKGSSIHSLSFSHGSLMVSSVQKCFVFRFKFAAKDFYPLGKGLLRVRSFCRV